LTNFKRVRPAGLLKERKPIDLLTNNLKVGKFSQVAELVDAVQLTRVANESILPVERSNVWWE
jgi:hypothetical protein